MSKQIKYSSTRGGETSLSYEDVLLSGLARDGGLFMPEEWPHFSFSELEDMKDSLEKPKKSRRKKPKSERNTISLNFT